MAEIILMEDSLSLRRILTRYLRDADHTVTAFENGAESRDADMLRRADVLVTDVSMPEVDGRQVMRNAYLHDPDLPIIVMTGEDRLDDPLLSGAFAYLRKPFTEEDFIDVVARAALKRVRSKDDNESISESHIANMQAMASLDHATMAAPMGLCAGLETPSLRERVSRSMKRLLGRGE